MPHFPDTQWSLIRRSGETPSLRQAAFAELARDYRPAILAFFRARIGADDAQDATQSFLAVSFEHRWWARARADAGSFRGFLLMLLRRHLGHLRQAQRIHESLDDSDEPLDPAPDAERQFDTRFALVLTQRALECLRERYVLRGRGKLFENLSGLLAASPEYGQLQTVAESLGLAPNTLTVELRRLRARLRTQVREELRQLCANDAAFEAELAALQSVLGGTPGTR